MKTNPVTEARVSALREAPLNSWIALSDDETRVIAAGASYQEVADELDRMGDESSVIVKTPPSWELLAV
jgi:TPP-dependent indolepyruvate ferredoxin oxidoreductase alpha subunit